MENKTKIEDIKNKLKNHKNEFPERLQNVEALEIHIENFENAVESRDVDLTERTIRWLEDFVNQLIDYYKYYEIKWIMEDLVSLAINEHEKMLVNEPLLKQIKNKEKKINSWKNKNIPESLEYIKILKEEIKHLKANLLDPWE